MMRGSEVGSSEAGIMPSCRTASTRSETRCGTSASHCGEDGFQHLWVDLLGSALERHLFAWGWGLAVLGGLHAENLFAARVGRRPLLALERLGPRRLAVALAHPIG